MSKKSSADSADRSDGVTSAADKLIELSAKADLFHTPDRTAFADLQLDDHRETWLVRSKAFRLWLSRHYLAATGGAPSSTALSSALNLVEARAQFEGPERTVSIRITGAKDQLYLDLGDENWRCVEISSGGWRVIEDPPVRFRRPSGMLPLAEPIAGGSIEDFRPFVNLRTDDDFVLVIAWLLAALRDRGPYPVLVLAGEQGSAKSTLTAMLRSLIDPNVAPLRALPRHQRDLFITASNGHVLAFDNVSVLPDWLSDTLCRIATGGGFATRQLFSDREEALFDAVRPVILNGIEDMVRRPDLADRSIFVPLEPIGAERRLTEEQLWRSFIERRPGIMGAILSAAVRGLKAMPFTRLASPPRMADFALWATACEGSLWPAGTFIKAYRDNRQRAVDDLVQSDPLANAVRALVASRKSWSGTASELLAILRAAEGANIRVGAAWQSPRALADGLRRTAPFLRETGIAVGFARTGHGRNRTISLEETGISD